MSGQERLRTFRPTLELLAARWGDAGPLLRAFSLFARGTPASVEEIAGAAGVEVEGVERALDAAQCERDAEGRVLELYGMTLTPTPQRLEIDGKIVFACCALWAHVIPKLVDATVRVESADPLRREIVRLTVSPGGVEAADPAAAAATLAVARREAVTEDVGEAFCSNVRHFVSRESAEEFAAARPGRHAVSLAVLEEAADFLHAAIWSTSGA